MKLNVLMGGLMIAGMAIASNVSAQTADGSQVQKSSIKKTYGNQAKRVRQGVKSGELTRSETKNIRADEKDIREDAKLARADGKVTAPERKIIKKDQRQTSREIYRKKHNGRERS